MPTSHGINTYYQHRYNVGVQSTAAVRQANPAAPAEQAASARSTRPAAAAASDLSSAEQTMIDRYFPASEQMSLRLYGPGQSRTLNPGRVGGRLDIQG